MVRGLGITLLRKIMKLYTIGGSPTIHKVAIWRILSVLVVKPGQTKVQIIDEIIIQFPEYKVLDHVIVESLALLLKEGRVKQFHRRIEGVNIMIGLRTNFSTEYTIPEEWMQRSKNFVKSGTPG